MGDARGAERAETERGARESGGRAPDEQRRAALLTALEVPIERKRSSWLYRAFLALAVFAVLVLPLVYFALVAAAGWSIVWCIQTGRYLFVLFGAAVLALLLKAIIAKRARPVRPRRLEPEEQPLLFAYVRSLSQRLGAPVPARICVDTRVNASASFLWGLGFASDDLVLTLGLPLVSSTRLDQFTAILAHEFGHFSQGTAMRSCALMGAVNRWFARAVHERDLLDELLASAGNPRLFMGWHSLLGALLAQLARGCIWLTRRLLYLLMVAANWLTALLRRRMELDADQNAMRLCGCETFVATMRRLPQIDYAAYSARSISERQLREGALSDDYPELVRCGVEDLGDAQRKRAVELAMDKTASMYDSHPTTRTRIEHAVELAIEGRFASEEPASVLFEDYAELCRELTLGVYERAFRSFDRRVLVPTATAVATLNANRDAGGLGVYFHKLVPELPSPAERKAEIGPPENAKSAFEDLKRARHETKELAPGARAARGRLRQLEERRALAHAARELREHQLSPKSPRLSEFLEHADLAREIEEQDEAIEEARAELDRFQRTAYERFEQTLGLLQVQSVRTRVEGPDALLERGRNALRGLIALQPAAQDVVGVRRTKAIVECLFVGDVEWGTRGQHTIERTLQGLIGELKAHMTAWHERVAGKLHPLPTGPTALELQKYFFPRLPQGSSPEFNLATARYALENWSILRDRLLDEVAAVGLAAEDAMNFRPLVAAPERRARTKEAGPA